MLADDGHAVLVATHDVEFVALAADQVVVLAEGEVVSDGPTREVLAESPAFAPQVHQDPRAGLAARRRGRSADERVGRARRTAGAPRRR